MGVEAMRKTFLGGPSAGGGPVETPQVVVFGLAEMQEFAEHHEDFRVRALWKRLSESRSNASRWCDCVARANHGLLALLKFSDGHHDGQHKNTLVKALTIEIPARITAIMERL